METRGPESADDGGVCVHVRDKSRVPGGSLSGDLRVELSTNHQNILSKIYKTWNGKSREVVEEAMLQISGADM